MKHVFNDISTISYKEFIELKSSYKRLLLPFCIIFTPLVFLTNTSYSILPLDILAILIPILMAFCASSQLSLYTIIDEKQNNNIEVLLSLDILKSSIIIGKSIIPTILGFILSIACILIMKFVIIYSGKEILFNIGYAYILITILVCYLGANISIFTTFICVDPKVSPIYSMIIFSVIMFILYLSIRVFGFNTLLLLFNVFIISILITAMNAYMLKNKVSLITKS